MERLARYPDINAWSADSIADLKDSDRQVIDGYKDVRRSTSTLFRELEPLVTVYESLLRRVQRGSDSRIAKALIYLPGVNHTLHREKTDYLGDITVFDKSGECQLKVPSLRTVIEWGLNPNEIDMSKLNPLRLKNTNWEHPHNLLVRAHYFPSHRDLYVVDIFSDPIGSNIVDHRAEQLRRLDSMPRAV